MPVTQTSPLLPLSLENKTARPDVPNRTNLVRDLTELFVARAHHTDEEIRHYEEIVLRMLPDTDASTLLDVTSRLAPYPYAPLSILQALVDQDQDCAVVILARSPAATDDMLTAAAQFGSADMAEAVARRHDLDDLLVQILSTRQESEVWRQLALNMSVTVDAGMLQEMGRRGRDDADIAKAVRSRTDDPSILLPLFLNASQIQRARILLEIERDEIAADARHVVHAPQIETCRELEKAALARNTVAFQERLAGALRCELVFARLIAVDPQGEPLAVGLKSLGMETEAIMRIFLTGDPVIAHSCEKIDRLDRLVSQMSIGAAQRICRAMLGVPMAARPSANRMHRPIMDQTAAQTTSRPAAQTIAPTAITASTRKLPLFLFKKRLR